MDFNIGIGDDRTLLIVRINEGNITIQGIDVLFVRKDKYKVIINDIPVNKYTLEQLKYVSKIEKTREPKISLKLNPGVTKSDIEQAKQMVKSLRN